MKNSRVKSLTLGDNIITAIILGIRMHANAISNKFYNCVPAPNAPSAIDKTYTIFIINPAVNPNKYSAILEP